MVTLAKGHPIKMGSPPAPVLDYRRLQRTLTSAIGPILRRPLCIECPSTPDRRDTHRMSGRFAGRGSVWFATGSAPDPEAEPDSPENGGNGDQSAMLEPQTSTKSGRWEQPIPMKRLGASRHLSSRPAISHTDYTYSRRCPVHRIGEHILAGQMRYLCDGRS
jgi:hypothetical protein